MQLEINEEQSGLKMLRKVKPVILISADNYFLFIANSYTKIKSGFHVIESTVGPVLGGRRAETNITSYNQFFSAVTCFAVEDSPQATAARTMSRSNDIQGLWALEHSGITDPPDHNHDE